MGNRKDRGVYPGGCSASAYLRIVYAWDACRSALDDGQRKRCATELVRASCAAGWSRAFLSDWMAWRVREVRTAEKAVRVALDVRPVLRDAEKRALRVA